MKLKKINVMGKVYKIRLDDISSTNCNGLTYNNKGVIIMEKTLSKEDMQQTFLHECIHAVLYRTGASQALPDGLEEVICDSIAHFLTDHFDFSI